MASKQQVFLQTLQLFAASRRQALELLLRSLSRCTSNGHAGRV